MQAHCLFSVFTGYTKGQVVVKNSFFNEDDQTYLFVLAKPDGVNIAVHDNIQLDGILAVIVAIGENTMTISTTTELVGDSRLARLQTGHKVSLGLCALHEPEENRGYLIDASSHATAKLVHSHVQPGHEHTWQLDFQANHASKDFIKNDQHLGLAGSTLTARHVTETDEGIRFSIFCGKATRESSCFNEDLQIGTSINLTTAYKP